MGQVNWLRCVADTSRIMHVNLSIAQKKLREQIAASEVTTENESRLVAKLGEAISSLSSVSIYAEVAANEHWCRTLADEQVG